MTSLTDKFDDQLQGLVNKDRQESYGHPADHFKRSAAMKAQLAACKDPELKHALEMILDKIARLIHSPDHFDSWIDIAGYARTGVMVLDSRAETNAHENWLNQVGKLPNKIDGDGTI